jgi:hypothetical protein
MKNMYVFEKEGRQEEEGFQLIFGGKKGKKL